MDINTHGPSRGNSIRASAVDGRRRKGDKRLCRESVTFRILVVIPQFYLSVAFREDPWGGQYKLDGALKEVKNGKVVNPPVSVTDGLIGRIHHPGAKIGKKWRRSRTSRFVC